MISSVAFVNAATMKGYAPDSRAYPLTRLYENERGYQASSNLSTITGWEGGLAPAA
jgi:hypothetical protein